jgi:uncharacterized membrane protein
MYLFKEVPILGCLTTVFAGAIAPSWGPAVGGLFLAFPAIFCASATLIEKHERERKQKIGVNGQRRSKEAIALDAAGAAIGLAAFALVAWHLTPDYEFGAIAMASVAWLFVSIAMWRIWRARPKVWRSD